jgi:hypothetical protein
MRKLMDEYGAACAARACAVQVSMGVMPPGQKAPLVLDAEARERKAREALEDALRQATLNVCEALRDTEAIEQTKDTQYADDPLLGGPAPNEDHRGKRRRFTLADARPLARTAALQLRNAWELLDPPLRGPFMG